MATATLRHRCIRHRCGVRDDAGPHRRLQRIPCRGSADRRILRHRQVCHDSGRDRSVPRVIPVLGRAGRRGRQGRWRYRCGWVGVLAHNGEGRRLDAQREPVWRRRTARDEGPATVGLRRDRGVEHIGARRRGRSGDRFQDVPHRRDCRQLHCVGQSAQRVRHGRGGTAGCVLQPTLDLVNRSARAARPGPRRLPGRRQGRSGRGPAATVEARVSDAHDHRLPVVDRRGLDRGLDDLPVRAGAHA